VNGIAVLPLMMLSGAAPSGGAQEPPADGPALVLRVERRAERFDYHVENPSNIEPGPLVPHFFEQRYVSTNTWIVVRASYQLAGSRAHTEFGITPRIRTSGSDVDTFFQPSGDVATSGTRGEVHLRSFAIRQWVEMISRGGWTFGATIGYRRSTMDFLPSARIVTHTRPPSETREPVGGDETTWSHVIEWGVTAARTRALSPAWQLTADVEALPVTRARLTVSLPLKYPGELIRQDTFGFGARGRIAVERRVGRLRPGGAVTVGGVGGYRRTARYHERRLGAEVFVRLLE
jgi:hypothetical protein